MSWHPDQQDSDSENEDETQTDADSGTFAHVLMIDAAMSGNGKLKESLDLIKTLLLRSVLIRPKDLIGIVFYSTAKSPPPLGAKTENVITNDNTAIYHPLQQLSKSAVEYFINFCSEASQNFKNTYGTSEGDFALSIRVATNMIQQSGVKVSSTRITVFTDKSIPHNNCTNEYQKAIKKAKDLHDIGIQFAIVPMTKNFNFREFYKEFFCTVHDYDMESITDDDMRLVEHTIMHPNRYHKKQCTAALVWHLGGQVDLSVKVYNYFTDNVYPKRVLLRREDNSVVEVKYAKKAVSEDKTERDVLPGSEQAVVYSGGEKFKFTNEEIHNLKHPFPPGIRLLGFKDRESFSELDFSKSGAFLYPDEENIKGSSLLFRGLWEQCIKKEKIALCAFKLKRNTAPCYVALLPLQKTLKGESNTWANDGFHLAYLPFKSDFRELDLQNHKPVQIKEEDAAIKILEQSIKKLRVNYNPNLFEDPTLNILLSKIQEVAFNIEPDENLSVDNYFTDQEKLNSVIGDAMSQIKSLIGK